MRFSGKQIFFYPKTIIERYMNREIASNDMAELVGNCMSDFNEDDSSDDGSNDNDYCFDGPWSYSGLDAMMVGLDSPLSMEFQYDLFIYEKESNPSLDEEEEFVYLDFHRESYEDIARLYKWMSERDLHITNGLLRRHVEGTAPIRIRISRLDEELDLKPMVNLKQRGNEMFLKKKYKDAIDLYHEALTVVNDMYVGPSDQIEQIATILSNKAECELRLGMYDEAGNTATDALIFINQEKSRIRRAKAGMALATQEYSLELRVLYLVHAQNDLENVLDPRNKCTSVAKETSRKLISKIENELGCTKRALLEKKPKLNWDLVVRMYRAKHW